MAANYHKLGGKQVFLQQQIYSLSSGGQKLEVSDTKLKSGCQQGHAHSAGSGENLFSSLPF